MPSSTDHPETTEPAIVWFRHDLRVADNGALTSAVQSGQPVVCIYLLEDGIPEQTALGGAQKWWLHHSLSSLASALENLGSRLVLRRGKASDVIPAVVRETGAGAVYWNRRYEPARIEIDKALLAELRSAGIEAKSFDGMLLHEPTKIRTGNGDPYKVYTPFWRAVVASGEPRAPLPTPQSITAWAGEIASDTLDDWALLPTRPDWSAGIAEAFTPGEAAAADALADFLDGPIADYPDGRDIPSKDFTSKLSPHLAFGEITPFQIWRAVEMRNDVSDKAREKFRKEVVWREFAWHLLVNFDDLKNRNFNAKFNDFPWATHDDRLAAWQQGRTGYPIVDAGMRQLWQTGWMHNRVRMIVASFLIKHLLIDWREGEKWFWDTLVDADFASNPASWQWVAGSGADAAPYFRIFNPMIQGAKFDPHGDYVKFFIPELSSLPDKYIHQPWEAPADVLKKAGVTLGKDYPGPIVVHATARDRALAAYNVIKGA